MTEQQYWDLVTSNIKEIQKMGIGTCIYCGEEHRASEYEALMDDTAICPNCGVDAVVPDHIDEAERLDIRTQMFGDRV